MIRALCWIRKNDLVVFMGVSLIYTILFMSLAHSVMAEPAFLQLLNSIFLILFIVISALFINVAVDAVRRLLDSMIVTSVSLYLQDKEEEDRLRESGGDPNLTGPDDSAPTEKPQRKIRQKKSVSTASSNEKSEKPRRGPGRPRKSPPPVDSDAN